MTVNKFLSRFACRAPSSNAVSPIYSLIDIHNFGSPLQIVSNGIYKSIEHRAMVNSVKERLSVATFLSSNLDSELGPAPSLITPQNPAIFRRVPFQKYSKDFFARRLDGKSNLKFMKIHEGGNHTS